MRTTFLFLALFCIAASEAITASPKEAVENRMLAAWKVSQADGLGDVYFFYPDGLFVRQGVRRREFVTIGRWKLERSESLTLFDQEPRNTTLTPVQLAKIKSERNAYRIFSDSADSMTWSLSEANPSKVRLERIKDLPDRTENIYWGLGTEESYRRGLMRPNGKTEKK